MDYQYVASSADNRIVKGKVSAASEEAATDMLAYGGYRLLSLKEVTPFFNAEKLTARFSTINPREIVMFTRQLALLLESGTDVVTSLELLQAQVTNRSLKKIIAGVVSDVRGGYPLSDALSKHPRAFPPMYHRLVSVGEKTGNLETVLRRAADYIERDATTKSSIKGALVYPAILLILAIVVIGILVAFVLPSFTSLYASFNVELPGITKAFMAIAAWLQHYGLWLLLGIVVAIIVGYAYTKTPTGKYRWGKLTLSFPLIGHINLLNELSRCCRSMALLYGSGLPLPEIMTLIIQGTSNKAMAMALTGVQQDMIAGAGLSGPMGKSDLFMPLMVQMTAVGEETGNLDNTLSTVAESYETEADDKTKAMVALINPAMTIIIGAIVGFIALALLSAMYSIYGQVSF
jgi:type IV pilus assembly protein PilC